MTWVHEIIKIKTLKWLIEWHQIRADSWTKAVSQDKLLKTQKEKQVDNEIWYNHWKYHNDKMRKLVDKLEQL